LITTVENAKTKRCPYPSHSISTHFKSEDDSYIVTCTGNTCSAEDCMAWRWLTKEQDVGFCGMIQNAPSSSIVKTIRLQVLGSI